MSLSLHPNRGVTIGTGGGGSWGSGGANVIITGPLSGSGTLITTGTAGGGIALNNPSNTFNGNIIMRSGFIIFNESHSTPNLSGDGFLTATPTQLFGTANIAPGKVFTAGSDGASSSFDGRLTGAAGTFRKVGGGTLTLDTILAGAESTNLGKVEIQAGSIQFGTASSGFGDATEVNISSGATFDLNSIGDAIGGISGAWKRDEYFVYRHPVHTARRRHLFPRRHDLRQRHRERQRCAGPCLQRLADLCRRQHV